MNNKGFTYSSILINLLIAGFLLPIIVSSLKILTNINLNKLELQNEIGLFQLRRDLLIADNFRVDLNELQFSFKGETNYLTFNNNHLYRSPGTVIYLENIDYGVFDESNNHIYFIYYLNDEEFKRIIY